MQRITVCVRAIDGGLESALVRTLADAFSESAALVCGLEPACHGDIVVTTETASSPANVSDMTEKGERVVVLAAFPNEVDEAAYRQAGASAYLPMVAEVAPLIAAVAALMTSVATAV
jgi:hypothetical protein